MRTEQFMTGLGWFHSANEGHMASQEEQHAGEEESRETHRALEGRSLGHVHSAIGETSAPGKQMRRAFADWERVQLLGEHWQAACQGLLFNPNLNSQS